MTPDPQCILVGNDRDREILFCLEPWGEQYPMAPQSAFTVVVDGPAGGSPEIDASEDALTFWAAPGSIVRLYNDEEQLLPGADVERAACPPASALPHPRSI